MNRRVQTVCPGLCLLLGLAVLSGCRDTLSGSSEDAGSDGMMDGDGDVDMGDVGDGDGDGDGDLDGGDGDGDGDGDGCGDTSSDPDNCGACGKVCNFANGEGICEAGQCVLTSCSDGYGDCSGGPGNGCETALDEVTSCGSCGNDCTLEGTLVGCSDGSCVVNGCMSGFGDCNQDDADGCEAEYAVDPANCNACGKICKLGQACGSGICADRDALCSDPGAQCNDAACVQSGRFAVTDDVAVDTLNGRKIWARVAMPNIGGYWAEGVCDSLVLDGITNWRLPTRAELKSLIHQAGGSDCSVCNPAWDQAVFPPDSAGPEYWTSETGTWRIFVNMCDGSEGQTGGANARNLRCVHDAID